uniref:Zona pellucida-like domain containing 1 n=1 Tax=Nothobranchius kadleci TaxID=1051664 RepID=A0A1A8CIK3_NOTKA
MKTSEFQMNTTTSLLISGVIVLGVISICFFIFSLTLHKCKSSPVSSRSGVHNPVFD